MRLAILSDIHANLEALQAALADVDRRGVDAIVCLGDIVGYGPDPAPCVDLVRQRCAAVVLGNHDEAVAFDRNLRYLPKDGETAAKLHQTQLSEDQLAWLRTLPLRVRSGSMVTLAHAAPLNPAEWPRLDNFGLLQAQFDAFDTDVCFVGHSHRPAIVANTVGVHRVRKGHRYLIDVGSVGQPRDNDPRLSFGIFDTEAFAFEHVRLHYDIAKTVARIREVGLPAEIASRLQRGI